MIYYATILNDKIIGLIAEESQKDFLLSLDAAHKFISFEWTDEFNPPMISEMSIENNVVVFNK
jgi:hypothetical protein